MEVNGYKIEPKANLSEAYLFRANLFRANLFGANLFGADLSEANLFGANLSGANLSGAKLSAADLSGAKLSGANLSGAKLSAADLSGAKLSKFQITPKGYDLFGFKKLADNTVAVLKIPAEAERTACLVSRKCRAEFAYVVEGSGSYGKTLSGVYYKTGTTVYPNKYNPDIRVDCSYGIHFFLTYEEAEEW